MTALFAALVVSVAGSQATEPGGPTAAQLISKAMARYDAARSLVGRIVMVQSAADRSIQMDTEIQYKKPSLLYLRQTPRDAAFRQPGDPKEWLAVSDGYYFSYNRPRGREELPPRLTESAQLSQGAEVRLLTIRDIYAAVNSSIGDRSILLDVFIATPADLKLAIARWPSFSLEGKVAIAGRPANKIVGRWRPRADAPINGDFELYITDEGDILRYVQKERISVRATRPLEPVTVTTVWDADVKVNAEPNLQLFRIP
jgi:hypothetical protein